MYKNISTIEKVKILIAQSPIGNFVVTDALTEWAKDVKQNEERLMAPSEKVPLIHPQLLIKSADLWLKLIDN